MKWAGFVVVARALVGWSGGADGRGPAEHAPEWVHFPPEVFKQHGLPAGAFEGWRHRVTRVRLPDGSLLVTVACIPPPAPKPLPAPLDDASAARTLAGRHAAIRAAWQPWVQRVPSREGRLVLRLEVAPDGAVESVLVEHDAVRLHGLTNAIVRVAAATRFRSSAAGGTIRWPIVLRVATPGAPIRDTPPRLRGPAGTPARTFVEDLAALRPPPSSTGPGTGGRSL
ncbi:MAG: hypothetical protein AMXMBFR64_21520 [Myxococcales bacterium]